MTLATITFLALRLGLDQTLAQSLLGTWNVALAFRRELLCVLDVAYIWTEGAEESPPAIERCG